MRRHSSFAANPKSGRSRLRSLARAARARNARPSELPRGSAASSASASRRKPGNCLLYTSPSPRDS
eukprot:12429030-Prorocentrum_lima.AAC.1